METIEPIVPLEYIKAEYNDFIGLYQNFVNSDLCEEIIKKFDERMDISVSTSMIWKSDKQFSNVKLNKFGRSDTSLLLETFDKELTQHASQYIQAAIMHYIDEYDCLLKENLYSPNFKLQKTSPGGGYHVWHCESASIDTANRVLAWMIYLNDMPDGEGETEFYYQKRRINPTKGTMLIWPGHFTHMHRGLTVLTQDKYILTGWFIRAPKT